MKNKKEINNCLYDVECDSCSELCSFIAVPDESFKYSDNSDEPAIVGELVWEHERTKLDSRLNDNQPDPKCNGTIPIWSLVIEDMIERDNIGRQRYGTPLQANNGRDALIDAYQEALDLCVYLRQAIEERK